MREGKEEDLKARQNCRKKISEGRFESPLKHRKSGKISKMIASAKKGVWFFPEYIQEKTHKPFWPTKQPGKANQRYKEVSLPIGQKGHAE